ncbi:hemagglutinin repeat-containing protein, partial [Gallibacterium anatis]
VSASYGSDGFAFGVTAGGNYGKGYGNGDETTWRTSHIGDKASQTVSLIRDQDNTGQPHTLPCSRCRASAYAA